MLKGTTYREKLLIRVAAIFCSIWLCRNDDVFDFKPKPPIIHILFMGIYWLRFWKLMHKGQTQQEILTICRALEVVAMKIIAKHEWMSNIKLKGAWAVNFFSWKMFMVNICYFLIFKVVCKKLQKFGIFLFL